MTSPIISLQDVDYKYEQKAVLQHINLTIHHGAFAGLIGPNGGGKTTLIKLILGLEKPDHGEISLFGKPINQFHEWNRIGFVSQKANSFNKGFPATVYEVVSAGLTTKLGYFKFPTKQHKEKILSAIDMVGMAEYSYQNIGNLSGGQQQRVFIARALVSDPDFLILDEPTVGVDTENVQHFYHILRHLNKDNGITMLLVTHDTEIVKRHATELIHLNKTLQA